MINRCTPLVLAVKPLLLYSVCYRAFIFKTMIDIKIKTYPKVDEVPYLDVNKEYVRLDFYCIPYEGLNIKAKKEGGEVVHLCELDPIQAVQMAKAVLSFFNAL